MQLFDSSLQDPVKDGEEKIKKEYEDLHERLQVGQQKLFQFLYPFTNFSTFKTAFRNLED
jgi:hypothetical protein